MCRMPSRNGQSAGGNATAKVLRAKAHAAYYANPNYCLQCGALIRIGIGQRARDARRKKFCDHRCAAIHQSPTRKITPRGPVLVTCGMCRSDFVFTKRYNGASKRRYCDTCAPKAMVITQGKRLVEGVLTKAALFSARCNWQSARSSIRRHAAQAFAASGIPLQCLVCGYSKYVEVCHKRPVAEFPGDATLDDINRLDNLIALCPNHHWEFDDGLLKLST